MSIKSYNEKELLDVASELRSFASRLNPGGFTFSIKRRAEDLSWDLAEIYYDVAVDVRPGREEGLTIRQPRSNYSLSDDDAAAKDLLGTAIVMMKEPYLKSTSWERASEEIQKVAERLEQLCDHKFETEGLISESNGDKHKKEIKQKKAGKGRPTIRPKEAERRSELVEEWKDAKKAKISRHDFTEQEGISVDYLKTCMDWVRKKKRTK